VDHAKVCGSCRRPFIAKDIRRLYCDLCRSLKRNANRTRRETRASHDLRFVGVDGEGVDRPDGSHDYIMLSVGNRTLFRDGEALSLREILHFLWECHSDDPEAVHVGFFLGYDFTQWFRQLPEREARFLFTNAGIAERRSQRRTSASPIPDPVVYGNWEFDIMAGRRFKLRTHRHERSQFNDACRNRTCAFRFPDSPSQESIGLGTVSNLLTGGSAVGGRASSNGWLYICDTGSFWQTSFLNVVKPENWHGNPVVTDEEYSLLKEGKDSRGIVANVLDAETASRMVRYNTLENVVLARVTDRLNRGFMNDEIPIRLKRHEWFGPGRAAQTWMDMLHGRVADKHAVILNRKHPEKRSNEYGILNADVYMSVPSWFIQAAQDSYYGGWFEIPMHGHIGTVWEYDINSAYPAIIATLPCLHTSNGHTGSYSRGTGPEYPRGQVGRYTLLYGTFTGHDPYLGTLPFRTPTGNILRPHRVKGWYWAHEVMASKSARLISEMDVHEWVSYDACDCAFPFDPTDIGIRRMYNLRLQTGKNTASGKAFKLVYNSAYGKTAQSIGDPKFANAIYASLITAGCRTLILDSIARHPMGSSGVAMVATDGIYFLERHAGLPLSDTQLGAWDETRRDGMTLLMPGVYWDDKAREDISHSIVPKMKSRGVSARDLMFQIYSLDQAFAEQHVNLLAGLSYEWPEIEFPIRFQMVSSKLALHRGKWNTAGNVEHDVVRKLSANPESKRMPVPYVDLETGIVRTRPYPQWSSEHTTPYHRSFGYINGDIQHLDDYIGPDGRDVFAPIRDALHKR
jgi:hypothetical protein